MLGPQPRSTVPMQLRDTLIHFLGVSSTLQGVCALVQHQVQNLCRARLTSTAAHGASSPEFSQSEAPTLEAGGAVWGVLLRKAQEQLFDGFWGFQKSM